MKKLIAGLVLLTGFTSPAFAHTLSLHEGGSILSPAAGCASPAADSAVARRRRRAVLGLEEAGLAGALTCRSPPQRAARCEEPLPGGVLVSRG